MKKVNIGNLTTKEKIRLLSGKDCWFTCDFDGKIPSVRMTDASMGIRMPVDTDSWDGVVPSVAYPSLQMLANTWDLKTAGENAPASRTIVWTRARILSSVPAST